MARTLCSPSGLRAVAEVLTWDVCAMRITSGATSFVACLAGAEYEEWAAQFVRGQLDAELWAVASSPPRRRLRVAPRSVQRTQRRQPTRVGVEHEFGVVAARSDGERGAVVDFRSVLPRLLRDHARADPADRNAVRLGWGVVTADGPEAEVATPPIEVRAGFVARTVCAISDARAGLDAILPHDLRLIGFSTHISVSWDRHDDDRLARRWAAAFGPVMMLLLDGPESPGLIVRPRPRRLELCGDFCTDDRLAAAVGFAAATVRQLVESPRRFRPVEINMRLVRAVERYGYYIDRSAFGCDLYSRGRDSIITRRDGTRISAGDHLAEVIDMIHDDLIQIAGAADIVALQSVRNGTLALATDPIGVGSRG
jgi:hypothetical protein